MVISKQINAAKVIIINVSAKFLWDNERMSR